MIWCKNIQNDVNSCFCLCRIGYYDIEALMPHFGGYAHQGNCYAINAVRFPHIWLCQILKHKACIPPCYLIAPIATLGRNQPGEWLGFRKLFGGKYPRIHFKISSANSIQDLNPRRHCSKTTASTVRLLRIHIFIKTLSANPFYTERLKLHFL